MVSSISSSLTTPTASMMYEQQIQALDSQIMRLESQISGLQEKILDVQENERLSDDKKKESITNLNEQINKIRDRISDIQVKISETRNQQMKNENEAKKRRQAAEERTQQVNHEEEEKSYNRALFHAIAGIDLKPSRLNATKAQMESRLREAKQEDMFRVREDGIVVIIQRENRRPRNPEEAQNAQTRIDGINASLIRDKASTLDSVKKASEDKPQTKEPEISDEELQGISYDKQHFSSGTGRMGKGQYLEDKA